MVNYIDTILNKLLSDCSRFEIGDFNPKDETNELLDRDDSVCPHENIIEGQSISYVSPFPKIDNRAQDHRIRYGFER